MGDPWISIVPLQRSQLSPHHVGAMDLPLHRVMLSAAKLRSLLIYDGGTSTPYTRHTEHSCRSNRLVSGELERARDTQDITFWLSVRIIMCRIPFLGQYIVERSSSINSHSPIWSGSSTDSWKRVLNSPAGYLANLRSTQETHPTYPQRIAGSNPYKVIGRELGEIRFRTKDKRCSGFNSLDRLPWKHCLHSSSVDMHVDLTGILPREFSQTSDTWKLAQMAHSSV